MRKGCLGPNLKLTVPASDQPSFTKFLTESGTFKDGNLLVNKDGVQIVSQSDVEAQPPIRPIDNQLSLADIDTIKVIGKGNGGIVQLVQHKWTNQFFALKVLKGLIYLHHEKHIIHRDLKPSNLLINHRGEAKITDFGVSAVMKTTSEQANTFIGTYIYMSPERISGSQQGYNYKSDIWSLGLMLLECATGRFPYTPPDQSEGWENMFQLIEAIVEKPTPSAPSDECSPEFCSFISACLQKNPRDRPSAPDLMRHPFINMYDDLDVDLSAYFSNAGSTLTTI